ncbi:MAG: paraquat-inducible protein A [Verrucomicrobiaceae bacterium]
MNHHHTSTWPRVAEDNPRVACHFCDTLHDFHLLDEGLAAHCRRCDQIIYRNRPNSLHRTVAFGITALCLMALVLQFPFLTMDVQGNRSSISIPGAVMQLWQTGGTFAAASVSLFVLSLPLIMLGTLLYLCIPLLFGKALPGSIEIMRLFQHLQSWVMVEVFFLGAIVSLLKLVKLADIELGLGFWAVAALMICLAGSLAGIDRNELWDRLEVARNPGSSS